MVWILNIPQRAMCSSMDIGTQLYGSGRIIKTM